VSGGDNYYYTNTNNNNNNQGYVQQPIPGPTAVDSQTHPPVVFPPQAAKV
jgi:hypothetical protein